MSQWVGDEPAADVAAGGINRSSSNSPTPYPTTTAAATATATTATALDTQTPLAEEVCKARIGDIMGAESSRTETASHVHGGAAAAASAEEERAPSRLSGADDVSDVLVGEVQTVGDGAQGEIGDKAPAEEGAIENEDLRQLSADGGVSSTAESETACGVVEYEVLDDATEAREAAAVDAAATAEKKKEAADSTTLEKTPSMLEMLKLKKGLGIFGKSSSVGQNKVSPSPTSTAPTSSLPASVATTEAAPESDTEQLRVLVEVDGQGAEETPGGLEGGGGTGAVAKTKTTAASAASPSMMDLSSRFRLGMGMFGSGKSSPRVVTGSGCSPKLGTQAAAAAAAAVTTSPASGSAPVEASPTPSSSSGGVGKFSSYARRAGNFLGDDTANLPNPSSQLLLPYPSCTLCRTADYTCHVNSYQQQVGRYAVAL